MNKKPIHKIRVGRGVAASIWENEGSAGAFFTVTLDRAYRNGEEVKSSSSFGRDDLLLAGKALDQAHTWILEQADAAKEEA
jgi:hypothetical protein